MTRAEWPIQQPLLADGSLVLLADAATEAQARQWLPDLPAGPLDVAPAARIRVELQLTPAAPTAAAPALKLGPIQAWIRPEGRISLHARDGAVAGAADLGALAANVVVARAATASERRHPGVFSALTVSAALLLNRMRRALLHAAAVVAPDGRAWLLVGDAFAGKTTTTVSMILGGWDYLSDDHVVLGRAPDGAVTVEGWPRAFHLDRGYDADVSVGERVAVNPRTLGPGRWRRAARLGGVLFPTVASDRPTEATGVTASNALARIIRQSPWLFADQVAARDVLGLLQDTASRPAYALRLGRDSYRGADRLLEVLQPAINPS